MIAIYIAALLSTVDSQIFTSLGNGTSVDIVPTSTLSVTNDSASPFFPNDYFINLETSTHNLYILESTNIVQVYSKTFPNNRIQTFSDYSYASIHPYVFILLSVNPQMNIIVLTSYRTSLIEHLVFSISSNGIGPLMGIFGSASISTP